MGYYIRRRGCVTEVKTSMTSKYSEIHRVTSTDPLEAPIKISDLNSPIFQVGALGALWVLLT